MSIPRRSTRPRGICTARSTVGSSWNSGRRSMRESRSGRAKPAARCRSAHRPISCSTASRRRRNAPPTIYFWSTVRSWGLDDANVSKIYKDMTDLAFAEDARIVESQQALIDSDTSGAPLVSLAFDRAALGARRIIKRKLEEEANAQARPARAQAHG